MIVNSKYNSYLDFQLDMKVFQSVILNSLVDLESYKQEIIRELEQETPIKSFETMRYQLSDLVSADYVIEYNNDMSFTENELLVDFDEIGGTEDYDIADELNFDLADIEDVKSRCIINAEYSPLSIDKVHEINEAYSKFLDSDLEEFSGNIAELEREIEESKLINTDITEEIETQTKDEEVVMSLDEEVIDFSGGDDSGYAEYDIEDSLKGYRDNNVSLEDDEYSEELDVDDDTSEYEEYEYDDEDDYDENFSEDEVEEYSEDEDNEEEYSEDEEEDYLEDGEYDSIDEDNEEEYSEDDEEYSEDEEEYSEDEEENYLEDEEYDSIDEDNEEEYSEDEEEYNFVEEDEEDEEDTDEEYSEEEEEDTEDYIEEYDEKQLDEVSNNSEENIEEYHSEKIDSTFTSNENMASKDITNDDSIDDFEPEFDDIKVEQQKTTKQEEQKVETPIVKEEEPKDLIQFIRKHPRCEVSFALQYFSKKEIEKNIMMGRIIKKGNKLYF